MRGHRILWHDERTSDIARGQAIGFVFDEKTKSFEPGWLGECREGENCIFLFHISRLLEMWTKSIGSRLFCRLLALAKGCGVVLNDGIRAEQAFEDRNTEGRIIGPYDAPISLRAGCFSALNILATTAISNAPQETPERRRPREAFIRWCDA